MLTNKLEKGIAILLFLFVFIYLLLRSFYVEPLHDEVSVLYMYFESGKIYEEGVIQDAGNHLLQTYLSHYCYQFFGDSMFSLRLPVVLSFIIYFFGTCQITSLISNQKNRIISLISLNSIPFIIEYFANARGYGMGLSFFIWLLFFTILWSKEQAIRNAIGIYFFAYFSVFSVIIYIPSALLAILFLHFIQLLNIKTFPIKKHLLLIGLSVVFIISLFPFYYLSLILKNGGGFYHGSLNGIWSSTGVSLVKNVFFSSYELIKLIILIIIGSSFIYLLFRLKTESFKFFISNKDSVIAYYFFGNLICISYMAWKMKVNYPEDRVAMHLILLFLIFLMYLLDNFPLRKYLYFIFLFFPVSFLIHLNLSTSVFSSDNRMSTDFYKKVRSKINTNMVVGVYPMQELCWSYHEKHNPKSAFKITTNWEKGYSDNYDLLLMKENRSNVKEYKKAYKEIAYEPLSGYHAFLNKNKIKKSLHFTKLLSDKKSNDSLFSFQIWKNTAHFKNDFICSMNGTIRIDSIYNNIEIRFESIDKKGIIFKTNRVPLRWYYGSKKLNIDFKINQMLKNIHPSIDKINCYIWNPQRRILTFRNVKLNIYEIIK